MLLWKSNLCLTVFIKRFKHQRRYILLVLLKRVEGVSNGDHME